MQVGFYCKHLDYRTTACVCTVARRQQHQIMVLCAFPKTALVVDMGNGIHRIVLWTWRRSVNVQTHTVWVDDWVLIVLCLYHTSLYGRVVSSYLFYGALVWRLFFLLWLFGHCSGWPYLDVSGLIFLPLGTYIPYYTIILQQDPGLQDIWRCCTKFYNPRPAPFIFFFQKSSYNFVNRLTTSCQPVTTSSVTIEKFFDMTAASIKYRHEPFAFL